MKVRPNFKSIDLILTPYIRLSFIKVKVFLVYGFSMEKKTNTKALKAFSQAVREVRKQLHLTQEQLSERCNMHPVFISEIERGIRNPSLDTILKLAEGLELEPGELINMALGGSSAKQEMKRNILALISRQKTDDLQRIYSIIKAYIETSDNDG